ncbi:MAG: ATP-binding protein [Prevotellaceae bacterium]|jgi:predicted AAA+ superfamily ATPase|nr:ATP-binding protein [Prevotellaceae bacterium]
MERKILQKLLEWKISSDRMPLILTGARQVGKTYSLLKFGRENYKSVVYLNFENNAGLSMVFERDLKPERIIRELSVIAGESIYENDTLLIFDEIQACEKALTSLKYFCEDAPNYHVAAAGSLLGVTLNRSKFSFPVGKINKITLYPLDFEEFLLALEKQDGLEMIRECFENNSFFPAHNEYIDLYKTFLLVGGMPFIVNEYLKNKNFVQVSNLQSMINDAYVSDMAKYAQATETNRILSAFNSIPAQLAKENRKFQYKYIKTGARAYEFENSLDWLQTAGIARKCVKISEGLFPLELFAHHNSFKIYLSDTGLLSSKFNLAHNIVLSDLSGFENVKGALAENYVFSTLITNGYTPFYWESEGKAEVDFVIQNKEGKIIPIEVKSSEHNRSKSLQQFVNKYKPDYSIRISTKNFGFENGIKSIPLYAVFCV